VRTAMMRSLHVLRKIPVYKEEEEEREISAIDTNAESIADHMFQNMFPEIIGELLSVLEEKDVDSLKTA